jgi:hypothetical protein
MQRFWIAPNQIKQSSATQASRAKAKYPVMLSEVGAHDLPFTPVMLSEVGAHDYRLALTC